MAGTEAGADAMRCGGVLDASQPVVEGLEADPRLGELALGPLMAVGAAPQREGGVGADLEERRSPFGVREVEVPVVGHRGLATPGDVGVVGAMPGVGGIDVAPPHRGPLLSFAREHQSGPSGGHRLVLEGAGEVLLGLTGLEAHDRDPGAGLECLELGEEPLVVAMKQRGRRDGATSSIEQEPDQPELVLQVPDIAADPDAVHRSAAKADVLVQ